MKILKIKSGNNIKKSLLKTYNLKGNDKSFNPSNTEWSNSVYHYNKSLSKSYPLLDNLVFKYIKTYFNMYDGSDRSVRLYNFSKRKKLFSSRKVWVSRVQVKHTSNKVIINTYVYDRVNNIIMRRLNLYMKGNNINIRRILSKNNFTKILNAFYNIRNDIINLPEKNESLNSLFTNSEKLESLSNFYSKNNNHNNYANDKQISDSIKIINQFNNKVKTYIDSLLKSFFSKKKALLFNTVWENVKIILYCYKYISMNTLKYKKIFVINLLKVLSKIYNNKEVVLNIVYLKNYYFNSAILSQIIAHKAKDRRNTITRTFKKALVSIDVPSFRKSLINRVLKKKTEQFIPVNNLDKDYNYSTNYIMRNNYNTQFVNIEHTVLDNIENKAVTGVRLQAAGRLTRRFTAERSVKKIRYVGTIKNIDSSFKGLSTRMIRNNINSNTQYSKVKSKNRIGSFGIKGWISSV